MFGLHWALAFRLKSGCDRVDSYMGTGDPEKWLAFYSPFLGSETDARALVTPLEALRLGDARHPAKIMMHQTQRLVSLADDLPTIRPGNETLQLLFLLICAEHVAKLAHNFDRDGKSKIYVQNFFRWFFLPEQQQQLSAGITNHDHDPLSLRQAVDALYDVRCDVVHEGKYWGFHFRGGEDPILNCEPDVIVSRPGPRESCPRVSRDGGVRPKWRADGKQILFRAPNGSPMAGHRHL
jgi:hypothetical protein